MIGKGREPKEQVALRTLPRIFVVCMSLHPRIRHSIESQIARLIGALNASRGRERLAGIVLMLAALLFLVPACQTRTKVKVIPRRVAPGESVTLERAAAKGDDVFAISATAGQTLALDEYCADCAQSDSDMAGVRVFLADATTSKDLPSPEGFRDCYDWRWMNLLPTTGVYHIVVSKQREKRYRLRVYLLDAHDPIFDPGITADRISIAGGLFPPGSKLTLTPFEPSAYMDYCAPLPFDVGLPAHWGLEDRHRWLGVMSPEGLKRANPLWVMNGDLAELERATRPGATPVKPPFSGFDDSSLAHWGGLERLEGKSWRGLRWVAQYSPEEDELENPLTYVFAAISNDGKYFIWLWVDIEDIHAPFKLSAKQKAQLIEDTKEWEAIQRKANAALAGASPESFRPDLNRLDAVARSLELRSGMSERSAPVW